MKQSLILLTLLSINQLFCETDDTAKKAEKYMQKLSVLVGHQAKLAGSHAIQFFLSDKYVLLTLEPSLILSRQLTRAVEEQDLEDVTRLVTHQWAGSNRRTKGTWIKDHDGNIIAGQADKTPLHLALETTRNSDGELSEIGMKIFTLIASSQHTNPDITDADGHTPLHRAAALGNQAAVELLLQHFADGTIETNNGDLAKDLWPTTANPDVYELLDQASKPERPGLTAEAITASDSFNS